MKDGYFSVHKKLCYTPSAWYLEVESRITLTHYAWLPDRHLPDKALDLLDEACARARIPTISRPADRGAGLVVTAHTVDEVLAEWQGISAEAVLGAG